MTHGYCKVRNCDQSINKVHATVFHIPKLKINSPLTPCQELRLRRRKAWLKALGYNADTDYSSRELDVLAVCPKHFVSGKPASIKEVYNVDWAPSLHLGLEALDDGNECSSSNHSKVDDLTSDSKHDNGLDRTRGNIKRKVSSVSPNDDTMTIIIPAVSASGSFVRRKLPRLKPSPHLVQGLKRDQDVHFDPPIIQEVKTDPIADYGQYLEQNALINTSDCVEPSASTEIEEPDNKDSNDVIKQLKIENQRLLSQNLSLKAKLLETESLYKSLETDHRISMSKFSDLRYSVDMFTVSEKTFVADEERVRHFTGLPTFDVLKAMFTHIEPFMDTFQYPLTKFQQYILTLMCIRLNVGFDLLGYVFRLPLSSVSKIFTRVLQVMHARYTPLISWPARPNLLQSVPLLFREKFGLHVVVIADTLELSVVIDSIEVRMDGCSDSGPSPSTVVSDYSLPVTMKFLIGLTPQGAVTFVSKGFTKSLSEKELIETSGLLQNLEKGDIVICEKGSFIHEIVKIKPDSNTEHKPGGSIKSNLSLKPYNIQNEQSMSDVRLHTKRVTEAFKKTFTYWSCGLPVEFFNVRKDGPPAIDQMIQTCCALNNVSLTVVT